MTDFDLSDAIEAEASDDDDAPSDDGAPSFGDEMSERGFKEACAEYAEWAVEHYDTFDPVDLDSVGIEVSTKMKRAAGKAGRRKRSSSCFMRFAFGAYEKWGWGNEIEETIRHELVHIRQHQVQGSGGHGWDFKQMASEVDAPRHCKQFTDYTYGIFCEDCDDMVVGRHKRSKMVKKPERYRSKCCDAKCYSEKL